MSRIAYVNGRYVPHRDAAVHVEDRGYQFADAVYEVITVIDGKLYDCEGHLRRLGRSLGELSMKPPVSDAVYRLVMSRLVQLNRLKNGTIYIQVSRGVARRDHKFPAKSETALVMTIKHLRLPKEQAVQGAKAITVPDQRWARRDIKTTQLLANCLAKQAAAEQGAYEAIMIMPDGTISEGSSSNVWLLKEGNVLVTRPADHDILNGITRQSIEKLAKDRQLKIEERAFDKAELMDADEVFLTSATSLVTAITQIDDTVIGKGRVGEIAKSLRSDYLGAAQ